MTVDPVAELASWRDRKHPAQWLQERAIWRHIEGKHSSGKGMDCFACDLAHMSKLQDATLRSWDATHEELERGDAMREAALRLHRKSTKKRDGICVECARGWDGEDWERVAWPCATARALGWEEPDE